MISQTSRMKQLVSQRAESLRVLKAMADLLRKQLKAGEHPLFSKADVDCLLETTLRLRTIADKICQSIEAQDCEDDEAIRAVFTSPDGEKTAKEYVRQENLLREKVRCWQDKQPDFLQLEADKPEPAVARQRMMAHQFTALCRQAESSVQMIQSILFFSGIQFYVWPADELHFAGEKRESDEQGGIDE